MQHLCVAGIVFITLRVAASFVIKRWCIDDFEDILDIAYHRCKAAGII